ncbi:hypothetical protein KCV87_00750 [Actinosynnema pretiosum subsp. pretiosum]|uniref:Uncharacterized protein n=1 Tax=Actinosynnema pretiosum subsp. pretiosum TaxID=103721 RepID=A0AA45L7J7_9PSEU|nr:hypothetical protein APASM_3856 [Actinosynnema pretiosum subsp. pretiosum]QUF04707.1 hypothetical protein KCV87_00750 [Actinosynnema pretiosum subsp. pretiosum]
MVTANDLAALGLRPLATRLAQGLPAGSDLGPQEWRAVVELLTFKVTLEAAELTGEDWPVFSQAYDHTIASALAAGGMDHAEKVSRALHLSWVLLQRVPRRPGVELLDPDRMTALLLRELPMSVERAREQADRWRSSDKAEILRLHKVKGLLIPGLKLAHLSYGERLPEPLKSWEELWPSFP